jgi:hypothetical protein
MTKRNTVCLIFLSTAILLVSGCDGMATLFHGAKPEAPPVTYTVSFDGNDANGPRTGKAGKNTTRPSRSFSGASGRSSGINVARYSPRCFASRWPSSRTGRPSAITPEIRQKLLEVSPATVDRILKKDKDELKLKGKSCTKSVHHLKNRIPIRTFYTSAERKTPGYIQTDTVHHCGASTAGEYLLTLTATDVFSGWVTLRGLLNKAWKWTFDALSDVRATLPFPFLEYHRKQRFRAIMALNLSMTRLKNGVQMNKSLLPVPVHTRKTITVLSNRKMTSVFGNTSATTD